MPLLAPRAAECGEATPSIRELAEEMKVHRRLILAAYRELEHDGLVELRERSGIFFAPCATPAVTRVTAREAWVVDVLLSAVTRGISVPDVRELFTRHADTRELRAACIECNHDQTAASCAELRAEYGVETDAHDVEALLDDRALARTRKGCDTLPRALAGSVRIASARPGRCATEWSHRGQLVVRMLALR